MTQDPGATPSTPPMQALPPLDDATRVRPDSTGGAGTQQLDPPAQHSPARGSLRFYAGVSCGSILLALVIGIGGFLGLRGLGEESATAPVDRKSTRLNSSHVAISYAVFCLKKKKHGRSLGRSAA